MDYKLPQLPIREQNSNKGTFGKILNVSGSDYMTGAAYLSSAAALRVGAGYVELASCERVLDVVSKLAPEIVLAPLSKISEIDASVLLVGCALSIYNKGIFETALSKNLPTVIDADGLNILAKNDIKLPANVILTPHPKEASRLLNCTLDEVLENMEIAAKKICQKYNCITV